MKDVSSTTFGLIIAFLLPGFAGVFALSFWAPAVADLFSRFIEAESNVGRFLLMILCSLVVGLEVSVCRWLIFEQFLCRNYKRDFSKYRHLGDQSKLLGFRAAVDETYRYHQFWGGMAIVTPFIAWGLVQRATEGRCLMAFMFLLVEGLNIAGAWSAYQNYIDRTNRILEDSGNGKRLGADGRKHEEGSSLSASTPASTPATSTATSTATPSAEAITADERSCDVTGSQSPP